MAKRKGRAAGGGTADLEIPAAPLLRSVWLSRVPGGHVGFACKSHANPAAVAREVRAWLTWYQEGIAKRKAENGVPPNRGGRPRRAPRGMADHVRRYERAFAPVIGSAPYARSPDGAAVALAIAAGLKLDTVGKTGRLLWPKEKAQKIQAILRRVHPSAALPRITSPLRLAQEIVAVLDEVSVHAVKAAMRREDKNPL